MLADERGVMAALQCALVIHYSKERIPTNSREGKYGKMTDNKIQLGNSWETPTRHSD